MNCHAGTTRHSTVRWRIAMLLLFVISLTYVDRLNIAIAARHIQAEFAFDDVQIGLILSAFPLGYALFQIPGGVLADKFGPRCLFAWALFLWSAFTALTAIAGDLPSAGWWGIAWSFFFFRLLVGIGEAPAFPAANKMVSLWMAASERSLGSGIFIAGLGVGGVIAPPLIIWLASHWGWRASFWVTGALGLPLLVAWLWYVRDDPAEHRSVSQSELKWIRSPGQAGSATARIRDRIPWRALFSHPGVWALVLSYFLAGYVAYIFFTWSFKYIVDVRKVPEVAAAAWATGPFLAMAVLAPLGGWVSDRLVAALGRKRGRQVSVIGAMGLASLLLLLGGRIEHTYVAITLLALAAGFTGFAMVNWWAATTEIAEEFSGSLAGIMNTAGNLGGAVSPSLTPLLAGTLGWTAALYVAAGAAALAALLWLFIDPERRLPGASGPGP